MASSKSILIMGDFNINLLGVEKCNQYPHNFLLSLQNFSLFRQLIKPTRFHNNSATLIIYIGIMGILFPLLAIIIHHSAVFSTLLKHKCITENQKRDFSTGADPGIPEYFFVCVCWGGGGGGGHIFF